MAAHAKDPLLVDGIILAAPAIWGGDRMPLLYRLSLSFASTFAPGKTLTGARAKRQATDNILILRAMQRDELVVKATPLRAIRGMVKLMGDANRVTSKQTGNILFLLGCKDEIIPVDDLLEIKEVMTVSGAALEDKTYPDGWHLLFRDFQAERVWKDVAEWIERTSLAGAYEAPIDENAVARLSIIRATASPCSVE